MKLGILDQSIIHHQQTSRQAIEETIQTVKLAEQLGYSRFWVSEHHNSMRVAGSSPEILMTHLAMHTHSIRLGSGGIMLPNHSEYKIAENFRMLETLHPGRIDLGIGRAPGGDRSSASLLNPANQFHGTNYLNQLKNLQSYLYDHHETQNDRIIAMPQTSSIPEQWILTSSGGSSGIAGVLGMGLAIARFINGFAHPSIVETYKKNFRPSEQFPKPTVMVCTMVLCGETQEVAAELRKYVDYTIIQMARGDLNTSHEYDFIMNYKFTPRELEVLKKNSGRVISGTQADVKQQLDALATQFEADEIMITNMSGHSSYRSRSFELVAEAYQLCA